MTITFKEFLKEENNYVYHSTHEHSLTQILKSGKLIPNNNSAGYIGPGQRNAISFSRDKNYRHMGATTTIVFKKDFLKNKGKFKPHSWESLNDLSDRVKKGWKKRKIGRGESEELLKMKHDKGVEVSPKSVSHIHLDGVDPNHPEFPKEEKYDTYRKLHNSIQKHAKRLGIPVIYKSTIKNGEVVPNK